MTEESELALAGRKAIKFYALHQRLAAEGLYTEDQHVAYMEAYDSFQDAMGDLAAALLIDLADDHTTAERSEAPKPKASS